MISETSSLEALARRIADGVGLEPGTKLAIAATGVEAASTVEALVQVAHTRDAIPQVLWTDERFDHAALQYASDATLATPPPLELMAMEWADAYVALRTMEPPTEENHSPHRHALLRSAKGHISTARWKQTRWAIVRVPTPAWASFANLNASTLETEFRDGCLIDWEHHRSSWQQLATRLRDTDHVRIQSEDTDLQFDVTGRSWIVFAGEANFPDGEIATAPLEHSVSGHITFPHRFCFASQIIDNLRLEFTDGVVTDISADQGQHAAETLLATDAGSSRIGEFGIGLNPYMTSVTGDLFFDEKILGTVHIAMGRSYPECGGTNASTLHWDIVKDLRPPHTGSVTTDSMELIAHGAPAAALTDAKGTPAL